MLPVFPGMTGRKRVTGIDVASNGGERGFFYGLELLGSSYGPGLSVGRRERVWPEGKKSLERSAKISHHTSFIAILQKFNRLDIMFFCI